MDKLDDILLKLLTGITEGGQFLVAELPEVIQQLLHWYFAKSVIYSLIGFFLAYVVYRIVKFAIHFYKTDESYDAEPKVFVIVLLGSVVGFIGVFFVSLDWLQILIAPKVWLIEYASELVKPTN